MESQVRCSREDAALKSVAIFLYFNLRSTLRIKNSCTDADAQTMAMNPLISVNVVAGGKASARGLSASRVRVWPGIGGMYIA